MEPSGEGDAKNGGLTYISPPGIKTDHLLMIFNTALRSEDSTPTAPVVPATAGADYSPIRYPIPYAFKAAGMYKYYIHIHINDDDEVEPTEEFQLNSENIGVATDGDNNDVLLCEGDCTILIQIIDNDDGAGGSDGEDGGKLKSEAKILNLYYKGF